MVYLKNDLCLFALESSRSWGEKVARHLGVTLSSHEERDFEDGEHKIRSLVNVRNRDVYVIQSLYTHPPESVNDKLCKLLFFLGSLKDASAGRVTAIVPYLCYARKDRKTKSRDPVTTRYIARLFEAVRTDRMVTIDIHNLQAYHNSFRCDTDHLEARKLFVTHLLPILKEDPVVVLSPDAGGVKRCEQMRKSLEHTLDRPVKLAFMEKQRSSGVVSGDTLIGDIQNKNVLILDDLISTGTTMIRAAKACRSQGAHKIYALATHGLFVGDALTRMVASEIDQIVITDTIPLTHKDGSHHHKVKVLDASELTAKAIGCINSGESLVELLED